MELTSERGLEMLESLPVLVRESTVYRALCQAEGVEFDLRREAIAWLALQHFVSTATEEGLERWETFLALPLKIGITVEQRRERIIARLRGFGTANKALIKSIAGSYAYGTVEVRDQNDGVAPYNVEVEFISAQGVPAAIADIEKAIAEALPAHLAYSFIYNFTTWNEIDSQNYTWDALDALNLTWDEYESHL